MTNLEKADELYPYYEDMTDLETFQIASRRTGFIAGAEWKDAQFKTEKQALIDKACEWLKDNGRNYYSAYATEDRLIEDFKKAMKGGEE